MKFVRSKGWVHLNGSLYKTKIYIIKGKKIEYDDHCAFPVRRERLTMVK